MIIRNETRGTILAPKAVRAASFVSRLVGLLNRASLEQGEGLILDPSNSIHSFFMRFSFDAIFVDKTDKVVGIIESMRPFRISPVFFSSKITIELPSGTIKASATAIGDIIKVFP